MSASGNAAARAVHEFYEVPGSLSVAHCIQNLAAVGHAVADGHAQRSHAGYFRFRLLNSGQAAYRRQVEEKLRGFIAGDQESRQYGRPPP